MPDARGRAGADDADAGGGAGMGALDRITAKDANVKIMERALEQAFREKPLWFFTNIVMPLLLKETRAAVEAGDKVIEWRGLVTVGVVEGVMTESGGKKVESVVINFAPRVSE